MVNPLQLRALAAPILILGHAYSGKSQLAQSALFPEVATTVFGTADDKETAHKARIAALKSGRPPHWQTIEDNEQFAETLAGCRAPQILVDSLNQWLASRLLLSGTKYSLDQVESIIEVESRQILAAVTESGPRRMILVSSENTGGMPPPHQVPRAYRRLSGLLHCRVAAVVPTVVLVTAGIPHLIKGQAG